MLRSLKTSANNIYIRNFVPKKRSKHFIFFIAELGRYCRTREVNFNELEKRICHLSVARRGKGHKTQYVGQAYIPYLTL